MRYGMLAGVVSLLGVCSSFASAQSTFGYEYGFAMPSGNIQCQYDSGQHTLRCDIASHKFTAPARPADCPLAWGDSLGLNSSGAAYFTCHGDTVMAVRRVLPYGQTWKQGSFHCVAGSAGLRCANGVGHGFTLAQNRYGTF